MSVIRNLVVYAVLFKYDSDMALCFPESVPVLSPDDNNKGGVVHLLGVLVNFPVVICKILGFQPVLQRRLLCFIDPAIPVCPSKAFLCDFSELPLPHGRG